MDIKRVSSRAHRTLRHLDNYRNLFDKPSEIPSYLKINILQEGEALIGVYENHPGSLDETLVITSLGVHYFLGASWGFISYEHVTKVNVPGRKETASELAVSTQDQTVVLPVRGGEGKLRDVFEFKRFLIRLSVSKIE